jgi:pimeloyl-ACP methyl ester carboxylesterase
MIRDDILRLGDGRTLAYTSIGASDGPVVCYQHGAPGGRLELSGLDDAFTAAGIRVVTADRPGYGGSTPLADRTTADWTDDVAALADHVGIERFGVIGLSSGGPYAVACAALLRDRVVGAVVAAGNTDMSWPAARDGYLDSELAIMALDDPDAAVARCVELYGHDGAGFFEGEMDLGPTDTAWLADESNATALFTAMGEAFRRRRGGLRPRHLGAGPGMVVRPGGDHVPGDRRPRRGRPARADRPQPPHRIADPRCRDASRRRCRSPEPGRRVPGPRRGDRPSPVTSDTGPGMPGGTATYDR